MVNRALEGESHLGLCLQDQVTDFLHLDVVEKFSSWKKAI